MEELREEERARIPLSNQFGHKDAQNAQKSEIGFWASCAFRGHSFRPFPLVAAQFRQRLRRRLNSQALSSPL
jgi:hypothetical protein